MIFEKLVEFPFNVVIAALSQVFCLGCCCCLSRIYVFDHVSGGMCRYGPVCTIWSGVGDSILFWVGGDSH